MGWTTTFDLELVFARAYGFSLGGVEGRNSEELAAKIWQMGKGRTFQRVHVWEKDHAEPGDHGFEPGITQAALDAHQWLLRDVSLIQTVWPRRPATCPIRPGWANACWIASCWSLAYGGPAGHRADSFASRHPGGMLSLALPSEAVSRAWLKMEEALRWSGLPIPRGARVAELGSAPGGASQGRCCRGGCWSRASIAAENGPGRARGFTLHAHPPSQPPKCGGASSARFAG